MLKCIFCKVKPELFLELFGLNTESTSLDQLKSDDIFLTPLIQSIQERVAWILSTVGFNKTEIIWGFYL